MVSSGRKSLLVALPWYAKRALAALKASPWQQRAIQAVSIALLLSWTCAASRFWLLYRDWKRRRFLYLSSPLRGASTKQAAPPRWSTSAPDRWWGSCPCCKRPIDLQLTEPWPQKTSSPEARGRYAFVITIWGSSAEYVLGAMVLGYSIKKTGSPHARVCLYTEDVPQNFVAMLSKMWDCRLVEHVQAVSELSFVDQAHRFAKVFTKLRALSLVDFEKVLMLDIDLLIMANIDELFDLQAPAALRRGMNDAWQAYKHGDAVDGRPFFQGTESWSTSWGQGTGINAGVMLLQPDNAVLETMLAEIADRNHPSHAPGNGPEQDYLSRYWADAPWTYISVEYNFQVHQMFFALQPERAITTERARLLRTPEQIKVVHFSGNHETAKPWHRVLDHRFSALWPDRGSDDEYTRLFAREFSGYWLWVLKDAATWESFSKSGKAMKGRLDQDTQGMFRGQDGHIYRRQAGEGSWPCRVEIPQEVLDGSMYFLAKSLGAWFDTLEDLQKEMGFYDWGSLAVTSAASASQPPQKKGRSSRLQRRREPGGWWTDEERGSEQATVVCSAGEGNRFVKFIEKGDEVYDMEQEDLSGVFAKVVGDFSARYFPMCDSSWSVPDHLEGVHLWVSGVPQGETVLLAIVGLDQDLLLEVLSALSPLGVPGRPPACSDCRALAAVGVAQVGSPWGAPEHSTTNGCSWDSCHASRDIAYATLPL